MANVLLPTRLKRDSKKTESSDSSCMIFFHRIPLGNESPVIHEGFF